MGTQQLALMLCLVGCGQVVKSGHNDAAIDTPVTVDAGPDAFACAGSQMACGTACFDLMTDNNHCGMCSKACLSNEGCSAGSCIDATASCVNIKALNPSAASGPYTHTADNTQFFCDMSGATPVQYDGLALAPFNGTWPGYTIIDAAQLQNPITQQAFIWAFNKQGGMTSLMAYTPGNVCATVSAGVRMLFGGSLMFPSQGTTQTSTLQLGAQYGQELISTSFYMVAPLPTNFFTTYPATQGAGCGDGNNPGFWFKKH